MDNNQTQSEVEKGAPNLSMLARKDQRDVIVKRAVRIIRQNGGKVRIEKLCRLITKKLDCSGSHESSKLELGSILESSDNIQLGKKFVRVV